MAGETEVRKTKRGTPCAKSWDAAWIARVEAAEEKAGRRICGACSTGDTPCKLSSDHPSGRCKHHGGFHKTGAPDGNRNAQRHGLYSRRLMVCGKHCPMWETCPLASQEVEDLPKNQRPLWPFEKDVFDTAVEAELSEALDDSPMSVHLAHHGAMLSVMVWRAMNAMNAQPLVCGTPAAMPLSRRLTRAGYKPLTLTDDELERYGAHLAGATMNPYLDAYLRLCREYERWRRYMFRNRQQRVYEMKHNLGQEASSPCDNGQTPHPDPRREEREPKGCASRADCCRNHATAERSGMAFQAMDHGQDARATSGEAPACRGEAGDAGSPREEGSAVAGLPTEPRASTERSERLNKNQPRSDDLVPSPRGEGQGEGCSQGEDQNEGSSKPKAPDTTAKRKSKKRSRRRKKRNAKSSPKQPCILDDPRVAEIIRKAEADRELSARERNQPPPGPG